MIRETRVRKVKKKTTTAFKNIAESFIEDIDQGFNIFYKDTDKRYTSKKKVPSKNAAI